MPADPDHQDAARAQQPADAIYTAVRAHELMLNQAASAHEHAVITRLVTLNGERQPHS